MLGFFCKVTEVILYVLVQLTFNETCTSLISLGLTIGLSFCLNETSCNEKLTPIKLQLIKFASTHLCVYAYLKEIELSKFLSIYSTAKLAFVKVELRKLIMLKTVFVFFFIKKTMKYKFLLIP